MRPNINKTFIIEPLAVDNNDNTVISACTTVYTNEIQSCSGDTSIELSTGVVNVNGNLNIDGSATANTITTTSIDLGLDSENNIRIINADNCILNNDSLESGNY